MSNESLPKKLLVEGEHDRLFAEACCELIALKEAVLGERCSLKDVVQIGPAGKMSEEKKGNGKGNAIKLLPNLIEQLYDGRVTRLGLVIDADYMQTDGLGFGQTWEMIAIILSENGYVVPVRPTVPNSGFSFEHQEGGIPDFGLWIMPNNFDDGMLEDFIKATVVADDCSLLRHAEDTIAALPNPKFGPHRKSKAEVATWMAWQKAPGQGLHGAVGGRLLDFQAGLAKMYLDWLKRIFL